MNKKESELLNKLYEIEASMCVEDLNVNGIYMWPILRIHLFYENWVKISSAGSEIKKHNKPALKKIYHNIIQPIFLQIKAQIKDFKNNSYLTETQILFLSDSVNRRIKDENGKYIDIFTDLIGRKLNKNNITWKSLERCPNNVFKYPRAEKSKYIASFLVFERIKQLFYREQPLKSNIEKILNNIRIELESTGFSTTTISPKHVSNTVKQLVALKKAYSKILRKVRPRAVIQTDWYSASSMALNLACKDQNIPFIDYQHGVQGSIHIAYGNWIKPYSSGLSLLPDIFMCWTESDCNNIETWLEPEKGQAHCVGNILIDLTKQGAIRFENYSNLKNLKVPGMTNILLSIQPSHSLNQLILTQIEKLSSNTFWWIRLHPCMTEEYEYFKNILQNRFPNLKFNVELATTTPLPILLSQVDLHITYHSSVVIEASMMKVPSIILDTDLGSELYQSYIKSGEAVLGIQTAIPKLHIHSHNQIMSNQDITSLLEAIIKPTRNT